MQRLIMAAVIAAHVITATMEASSARDRPEGGLNREHGIAEASAHTGGPDASGKITFTDIVVTGRPHPGGND